MHDFISPGFLRGTGPALFHTPVRTVRRAALVQRCGMVVMRMLFTIGIELDYLSSLLSHREPSSPNSLDQAPPKMATHRRDWCNAPRWHAVRKTQSLQITHILCRGPIFVQIEYLYL